MCGNLPRTSVLQGARPRANAAAVGRTPRSKTQQLTGPTTRLKHFSNHNFLGENMTSSYPFVVFGDESKGRRVLVTGGTKGIGEAIVRRFELSGASVATTARSEPAPGQAPALFIEAGLGTSRSTRETDGTLDFTGVWLLRLWGFGSGVRVIQPSSSLWE